MPFPKVSVRSVLPIVGWLPRYRRSDLSGDLTAGLTVGAMLVPQGMAYALLAGLPPEVGLYASTLPLVAYALFGTSRQLAVGPVAIVSLLTASALAPHAEQGTGEFVAAAALLALIVGAVHLVLGFGRLGFLVNLLSHSVLVGFTAAAALVIGLSQAKHLFGIDVDGEGVFYETFAEVLTNLGETHGSTLAVGAGAVAVLVLLRRWKKALPSALVVVAATTAISAAFDLEHRGVAVVGDIPNSLPDLGLPTFDGGLVSSLVPTALVITLVGFMESIAIAKVYGRRNRYEVEPNQELIGLGAANVTAGIFGGYPVTGGFSRTAVNADAGARTPLASLVTAGLVLLTVVALTPLFSALPKATLAAVVVVAVAGLIDIREARHIAQVKRSDLLAMAVAFLGTLTLGIEVGIGVAVAVSLVVVFARMMFPHTAELGRLGDSTVFRNVERFTEASRVPGIAVLRIDVALSFANVTFLRKRLARLEEESLARDGRTLDAIVIDAGGINDVDASAEAFLTELLDDYEDRGLALHLANVKGPVRDVLVRAGLWQRTAGRVHVDVADAICVIRGTAPSHPPEQVDERPSPTPTHHQPTHDRPTRDQPMEVPH